VETAEVYGFRSGRWSNVPGSALLLIRLLLTGIVVAATWRFGMRGTVAVLVMVVALIVLFKAGRQRRDVEANDD
jgi:hypothetical protein